MSDSPFSDDDTGWVSVARHTIMSGLCIDWYPSVAAYERGGDYAVSASREGVLIDGYTELHRIPESVVALADSVYRLLATRRDSDREAARAVATHAESTHRRLVEVSRG